MEHCFWSSVLPTKKTGYKETFSVFSFREKYCLVWKNYRYSICHHWDPITSPLFGS